MTPTVRLAGTVLLGLPLVLAAGCVTAEPIVRLEPMATNAVWAAGRYVEAQEKGGVQVAAAFDHRDADRIAFRVEIRNDSERTMDVGPDAMTFHRFEDEEWSSELGVIDPGEVIADIDAQRARERADADRDNLALFPLLLLSAVTDVATVASGHADARTGRPTAALASEMDQRSARADNAVDHLGGEQALWMNAGFRRTTIPPGGSAAGLVCIPFRKNVRFVQLNVWAGNHAFRFMFKQYVTQV
jgi:hypothetical protein